MRGHDHNRGLSQATKPWGEDLLSPLKILHVDERREGRKKDDNGLEIHKCTDEADI
jgi:hypothetical protein